MKERVYQFRAVEKRLAASRPGFKVLDVGCGRGDNLRRLTRYGGRAYGIEPNVARAVEAQSLAPVVAAVGEALPWAAETFDMIYISHVLHHAEDVEAVLRECCRCLRPGGVLFVIETIEDSPLLRLARAIQPSWEHDEVLNRFRYRELLSQVQDHGLTIHQSSKFNWMYFAWELLPLAFRPFEFFTPVFILLETMLGRWLNRWGAHCWMVAEKPGTPLFSAVGSLNRTSPALNRA